MALIWRVLPLLFLANTGFAKVDYDVFAFSFCPDDGISFEIGRIKGEKFQVSFFHGLHIDNVDKGPKDSWRDGAGVLGFGMRKLLDSEGRFPYNDGKRELGFLIWPVYTQAFHRRKRYCQILWMRPERIQVN